MVDDSVSARWWQKVLPTSGCWHWTASLCQGYGQMRVGSTMVYAHRLSYEMFVGPVPEGMEIDHLCRNRGCVNPEHLEAVSHRENLMRGVGPSGENARKAVCSNGHPLVEENLTPRARRNRSTSVTQRECRICKNAWNVKYMRRRREAARVAAGAVNQESR